MNNALSKPERIYDLDWMRIIGIIAIFIFHVSHYFGLGFWHVKNLVTSVSLEYFGGFFLIWATSLVIRWSTGAMSQGGVVLLSWIWNAALILIAVYIAGYLWGTIWGSLIFVETGIAISLFRRGYEFPNLIPVNILPIYSIQFII